ncbi:hypothetical protein GCM10012275_46550 [Longimycelium tulufanense]|uniref:Helix-turn-helix domain-containing protein n=1 Tax=Longimycelium tulufanense TaxID=907463 RepID=A0A8J3CBP5_9PSEU|nr:helix-turn-helix domain-containing protein [Longimycelium tulufanense]GGM70798.1 hypothetical protein GCM10012275_46550 [Longimycelium tulufanense]
MTTSVQPRALTVPRVAERLNLSEQQVRSLIRHGLLAARQPGRRYIVPLAAVEEFLANTQRTLEEYGGALYTVEEAAALLDLTVREVREMIRRRQLHAVRPRNPLIAPCEHGRIVIPAVSIDRLLNGTPSEEAA